MQSVIYLQALSLLFEFLEDGPDMPKHVEVTKHRTFKCVCSLCIKFVLRTNKVPGPHHTFVPNYNL